MNPASAMVLILFLENLQMKKIYIGNLPYRATEQEIQSAFAQYGAIEEIALIKDRHSGRPKGFGFVTFETADAAQGALKMDGQDFQGRTLKVSIAKEKTNDRNDR